MRGLGLFGSVGGAAAARGDINANAAGLVNQANAELIGTGIDAFSNFNFDNKTGDAGAGPSAGPSGNGGMSDGGDAGPGV